MWNVNNGRSTYHRSLLCVSTWQRVRQMRLPATNVRCVSSAFSSTTCSFFETLFDILERFPLCLAPVFSGEFLESLLFIGFLSSLFAPCCFEPRFARAVRSFNEFEIGSFGDFEPRGRHFSDEQDSLRMSYVTMKEGAVRVFCTEWK